VFYRVVTRSKKISETILHDITGKSADKAG